MVTHKRINITLHPIELKKLDKIAKQHNETRSGMISRIIQDFADMKDKHKRITKEDADWIAEKTELSYFYSDKRKDKKKTKVK